MRNVMLGLLVCIGAVVIGGCGAGPADKNFFPPGERSVDRFVVAQTSEGGRADATLHPVHFDEAELNDLGRWKVQTMLAEPLQLPLTIYLNLPEDEALTESRAASVASHLEQAGFDEEQSALRLGANPGAVHPAAQGLRGLRQMEEGPARRRPLD